MLHNGALSASFVVGSGVIFLPVLFLVAIGDIIQASIAKHHLVSKYSGIRWKMDSFFQHLDYADDICRLPQTRFIQLKMRQLLLDLRSTQENQVHEYRKLFYNQATSTQCNCSKWTSN